MTNTPLIKEQTMTLPIAFHTHRLRTTNPELPVPVGPSFKIKVGEVTLTGREAKDGSKFIWDRSGGFQHIPFGEAPKMESVDNFRMAIPGVPGLFRGGELETATDIDTAKLALLLSNNSLSLGRIIDLRTPGTINRRPDREVPHTAHMEYPLPAFTTPVAMLTGHITSIHQVFYRMASAERPTYIHCTHGRDRTGLIVALLQAILGYPDSFIRDEFMKSPSAPSDQFNELMDYTRNVAGSFQAYATGHPTRGLGLTKGMIYLLRENYGGKS